MLDVIRRSGIWHDVKAMMGLEDACPLGAIRVEFKTVSFRPELTLVGQVPSDYFFSKAIANIL